MYEILMFSFDIVYLPGIKNIIPDALSHFYDDDTRREQKVDYTSFIQGRSGDLSVLAAQMQVLNTNEIPDGVYTMNMASESLQLLESEELKAT